MLGLLSNVRDGLTCPAKHADNLGKARESVQSRRTLVPNDGRRATEVPLKIYRRDTRQLLPSPACQVDGRRTRTALDSTVSIFIIAAFVEYERSHDRAMSPVASPVFPVRERSSAPMDIRNPGGVSSESTAFRAEKGHLMDKN
ncbi:hypothetical protein EVAR_14238_1 [Eumeta japonica]|uniref:Uncharacterized protein n=1 Tax=Eumeta variegata TaxID=151549 RepID=A0A4C1WC54_EUMVA|nr:hypothetical protein EVAR_14238_1 [Eumeta japonica]